MSAQREMTLSEWVCKLPEIHSARKEFVLLQATIAQQAEKLAAAEKDAARYRYFCANVDNNDSQNPMHMMMERIGMRAPTKQELDAAIDAAIAEGN